MAAERRVELILRVPNLTPTMADRLVRVLTKFARPLPGAKLSRIERDHFSDGGAVHVSRERVV